MIPDIRALAHRLQADLLRAVESAPADWTSAVQRVQLDAWATLARWNEHGERVWRISAAAADETADMVLPADLPLETAPFRAEAVAYQLPDRAQWVVIARHAPAPCVVPVAEGVSWAFRQPVLTYCTALPDGALGAGYYSLADYPTAGTLPLTIRPGVSSTGRKLTAPEVAEEDARVSLALLHHYLP